MNVLKETHFSGLGDRLQGKVRDIYVQDEQLLLITTDRHSSFDRIIAYVPHKGEVLNRLSAFWFEATQDIVPNHVLAIPDPNVTIAKKCTPLPIEVVIRGYITGVTSTSLWTNYQKGQRDFGNFVLPDGMYKNQKLDEPVFTPSTKDKDHDRTVTPQEIIDSGILQPDLLSYVEYIAKQLFVRGQEIAARKGLILVDTKYEFGLDENGILTLIDEVHTPDSSRYWQLATYEGRIAQGLEPEYFDKEFLRLWFTEHCDPYKDATLPEAPAALVDELSLRYKAIFTQLTGETISGIIEESDIAERILQNLQPFVVSSTFIPIQTFLKRSSLEQSSLSQSDHFQKSLPHAERVQPNEKLDSFFSKQNYALTFDDVRLETGYADFLPKDVDLTSRISRNVSLHVPLISAAMDTVTESRMAIALATFGAIGSIHRGLSPEAQSKEVARVKHHIHGLISEPIIAHEDETVAMLLTRRDQKKWEFHSFPVVGSSGLLVGLMTHQDFKRCDDPSVKIKEVMTPFADLITASSAITKPQAYELLKTHKKNVLPLIDGHRRIMGLYVFSDLKRILAEKSNHNVDAEGRLCVAAAVGVGESALMRAELLAKEGVDVFHIDTAHGFSRSVIDTIRALKSRYPHIDVIAGNVSRAEGALALAEAGADGVLVGQGGGSICTTRRVAGIGKPQVSAVYECAKALSGLDVPICSDGGIRESGDIVVALGVGASTVMVGGLLAGTMESPGDTIPYEGKLVKMYRGMGSLGALRDSASSRQRYLQTDAVLVPEGVEGMVSYKGPVNDVLEQNIGGLRKGMGYVGACSLPELWQKAELFEVTGAGVEESHPHDLLSYKEAPNYSGR